HTRFSRDWSSDVCSSDLTAFASAARPSLAVAVEELRTAGAQRVAVASYLLAEGFFADRVRTHCTAAGAQIVSAPLGDCPELAARSEERRVGKGGSAARPS